MHLQQRANAVDKPVFTPLQRVATRRQQLLRHMVRHFGAHSMFHAFSLVSVLRPGNWPGRPCPHWAELVPSEADCRRPWVQWWDGAPEPTQLDHHGPAVADWRRNDRLYRPADLAHQSFVKATSGRKCRSYIPPAQGQQGKLKSVQHIPME